MFRGNAVVIDELMMDAKFKVLKPRLAPVRMAVRSNVAILAALPREPGDLPF
jgi:hypothetical protein